MQINFLGMVTFNAPFLPLVLIGFTVVSHSVIPWADLLGLVVGHIYYYLEDIYPTMPVSRGSRPLQTPEWFAKLVRGRPIVQDIVPLADLQMENLAPQPQPDPQPPQ